MVGDDDDFLQLLLAEASQNRQIFRFRIEGGAADINGFAVGIRRVAAVVQHVEVFMAWLLLRETDTRRKAAVDVELLDFPAGEFRSPETVGLNDDAVDAQTTIEDDGAWLFRAERQWRVCQTAVLRREDDRLFHGIDARGEEDVDRFVFMGAGFRDGGRKRVDRALGRDGDLVGCRHDHSLFKEPRMHTYAHEFFDFLKPQITQITQIASPQEPTIVLRIYL